MTPIPASIRTNNPGAMYPGPSAKKFGSKRKEILKSKDGTHQIACFDDPVHGAAAQFDLLASPKYTGRTVKDAITKWCGGFYASTYLKVLEQNCGVTKDTVLTAELVRNPAVAVPLAKAMALQEAGKPYPMTDDQWLSAHELAFGVVLEAAPVVVAEAPAEPPKDTFTPDNPLPAPKPETRVATMKQTSRKWSVVSFIKRWFVGVPVLGIGATEVPQIQEQLNAFQTISQSTAKLGLVGWLLLVFFALNLVQKFMVEDVEDGRAVPKGS